MRIIFNVGLGEVEGRLPYFPARLRVISAYAAADTARQADAADSDPMVLVYAAAIGLCWPGLVTRPSADILAYGDAVLEELSRRGCSFKELASVGQRLVDAIVDSVPTPGEVAQAEDPSKARAGTSTSPTS